MIPVKCFSFFILASSIQSFTGSRFESDGLIEVSATTLATPPAPSLDSWNAYPPIPTNQSGQQSNFLCGQNRYNNESPLTERIVGGNQSHPGEWPWQVSLRLNHPQAGKIGHWCGGTLIDKQWVATAAHCILNPVFSLPQAMFWEVRVGEHNQKITEASEKTYSVSRVFHYPWYRGYDNDIALMKLTEPIEITDYVSPICLPPNAETEFADRECVASGWGKVDFNKRGADILQKVRISVYDNSECHRAYFPKFKIGIRQWHLCAGTKDGGKGTCHGDSGGPLQCKIGNQWYLAGITSFGSGCAKVGFPDVYSRVTHFLNWVNQLMHMYR